MLWESKKRKLLQALASALSKSEVDEPAIPVLDLFNAHPGYSTSSSCSGRTMLLEIKKSKKDASIFWKMHLPWQRRALLNAIRSYKGSKDLWLFCQGFIFHVYCEDMVHAILLLKFLRSAGLKRAGVISFSQFPVVEFMSNTYIALPVVIKGKRVVSDDYVLKLEQACLEKMRANLKNLAQLKLKLENFCKTGCFVK